MHATVDSEILKFLCEHCDSAYDEKGGVRTLYLNTGWSSSLNRYERRLLTQEAMLVTAHGM